MDRQVGGDHYLKLGMQPFQFSLGNGWDGGSHTILKYVSRHHNVPREEAIESLRKAIHIVEIIQKAITEQRYVNTACMVAQRYGMADYIQINSLDDLESVALLYLNSWIYDRPVGEADGQPFSATAAMVINAIEDILTNRYGVGA